MPGHSRA
jgi:CheY-like chemotaxis protein